MGDEAGWRVAVIEKESTLILHQPADTETGRPFDRDDPDLGNYFGWNWAFMLRRAEAAARA